MENTDSSIYSSDGNSSAVSEESLNTVRARPTEDNHTVIVKEVSSSSLNEKESLNLDLIDFTTKTDDYSLSYFAIDTLKGRKLFDLLNTLKKNKESTVSDLLSFREDMTGWLEGMHQNLQEKIFSLERTYQLDGKEKKELLSEMTSMNEELNKRGETISSLKEVVTMYEKKVIELNSQQDCSQNTVMQLRDELTERTQRLNDLSNLQETNSNLIQQLREELQNTRERVQDLDTQQNVSNSTIKQLRDQLSETSHPDHHVEADHLSTSTVSRVEESNRLRDVEESFEDRYCKLRVVAAKLKKRSTELQQLLDSEKQKWASEKSDLVNKLNQLTGTVRNNQSLQQECDRLADELEAERKESKMLRKAATDAKTSEVNLKVKLEECQTNIEILKENLERAVKERDNITQLLSSKQHELEAVTKEKFAEELIKKEKIRELTELEEKLKEKQDKLMEMQKVIENTKLEVRKQSVLSLEIQNYEKSLSEMSGQLSAEKVRVSSLEAEVQTLQDIRDSLQEQIRLLEERVEAEEQRSNQALEQLAVSKRSLVEAEGRLAELEGTVAQLNDRLESERASAETATLELASLSSAIQTNTDIMLREKQELSNQVASLTSQLATVTSTLEQTQEELAVVRAEFEKYKVRAQSVLRRHQNEAVAQEETEAKQQVEELRQLVNTYKAKVDESESRIDTLQSELRVAHSEQEAAETRCVNLNTSLAEKEKQLERVIAEHRTQKLSLETLVQCYKSQVEEREKAAQEQAAALTEEVEALRRQLSDAHNPPLLPQLSVGLEQATAATSKPDPPLLEREDGEGSEYIPEYSVSDSPPPASHKPLLPLEKLLENSDISYGDEEQVNVLRAELRRSRKQAEHQAALLADAEQDTARKDQLITVLKSEIGRLERCIQRQPHAKNTEYLKNIVFKFVTLETGEDRLRLVPVMTTLLQLSPDETASLTNVARGHSPEAAGWGSFLPSWR